MALVGPDLPLLLLRQDNESAAGADALAANALSVRRGLDPDRPPHPRKVTETV